MFKLMIKFMVQSRSLKFRPLGRGSGGRGTGSQSPALNIHDHHRDILVTTMINQSHPSI